MENGQVIKGYELKERIGAGGFGAVYRAYQSTVGREVAMKIILPHFANHPDFIRRFETEAQLVARLEHPYIIPLYDYWRELDSAYLVMRYLRGGSLREALKEGAFAVETAVLLIEQIAAALSVAHRAGVIHRDLKPANILLDEDGNAYLADFGIAKDTVNLSEATEMDAIVGSPDYLSPEQARSEAVTPQTDIYSLGVVLYEMLTGAHPFPNLTPVERLYKHLNEPLPIIDTLKPELSEAINAVIQKATAKNPLHRYGDVLEMAAAFRAACAISSSQRLVERLTLREQEILRAIIDGRSNKEIAQELFVSVTTVKWHIRQIYAKLGVRSRVQAIVRARELNLIVTGNGEVQDVEFDASAVLENPYKGLRAFTATDHKDFFGREKITEKLVKRLSESGEFARFLAVVGPSGSGKSSLVKAGLIPAIWKGALAGSEKWFVVEMLPGARPLDELEIALAKIATHHAGNLHEHLARDEYGLSRIASLLLPNDNSELLLVIDQFEEVFTLVDDEQTRQHFLNLLYNAVTQPRSRVRVVVTLRADFYDRPLHYAQFGELLRSRMETVLPLSAEELERAIAKPAESVGVKFEAGLVTSIVGEVNYQPGALPLLQYALTELFEQREGRLLTRAAYQALGGTAGALAKRADEIYLSLATEGQESVRQMFLRLVTLGEGTEDTRRRAARAELLAIAADTEVMDEVIDTYTNYRLLSLDNDPATRTPTVEVAHEAILREWERLRVWLHESRDDLRLQRQVMALADEWHSAKQDASFLLRGARLEVFEKWAQATQLALTEKEKQYIDASIGQRAIEVDEEEKRRTRELRLAQDAAEHAQKAAASQKSAANRLRQLVAVMAIAVLGALGLSGIAVNQSQAAQLERDNAQFNFVRAERIRLSAQAGLVLNSSESGDLASLLAMRSLQYGYSADADVALTAGLTRGFPYRILQHSTMSNSAIYSADGEYILTAAWDGKAHLWEAQSGSEIRQFSGDSPIIWTANFSADDQFIVAGDFSGTVYVWEVATGERLQTLRAPGQVFYAAYTNDGRYFYALTLIQNEGFTLTMWDAETFEAYKQVRGAGGGWIALSPDYQFTATASGENITIADLSTNEVVHQINDPHANWSTVSYSPDSHYLVAGGWDDNVRVWDAATFEELHDFESDGVWATDLSFSADGRLLAVSYANERINLWDLQSGELLHTFFGHSGQVQTVNFSPDGQTLLSGSNDGTARLWELQAPTEPRIFNHNYGVWLNSITFSTDGSRLLTGGTDHIGRLWDFETGELLQSYDHEYNIHGILISPNSRFVVTSGIEQPLTRVWSVESGEELESFSSAFAIFSPDSSLLFANTTGENSSGALYDTNRDFAEVATITQAGAIVSATFSADGSILMTASSDGIIYLREVPTGTEIRHFETHSSGIGWVSFSPDGRYIAASSADFTAKIWDAQTGELVRQFVGHTAAINSMFYSPDGRYLITASVDESARVWDVETGAEVRRLMGHDGGILRAIFSPDGRFIVTSGEDGTARVWIPRMEDVIAQVCQYLPRDFTASERETYLIDDTPTCPQFAAATP